MTSFYAFTSCALCKESLPRINYRAHQSNNSLRFCLLPTPHQGPDWESKINNTIHDYTVKSTPICISDVIKFKAKNYKTLQALCSTLHVHPEQHTLSLYLSGFRSSMHISNRRTLHKELLICHGRL